MTTDLKGKIQNTYTKHKAMAFYNITRTEITATADQTIQTVCKYA